LQQQADFNYVFGINDMKIDSILPSESIVKRVLDREVKDLPAFPVVAMKILQLIGNDEASAADIAKVIESDPAVTAKVLRLVNSAAYGLRNRISSVKESITFLGFSTIRRLALQVTLFEQIVRPQKTVIFDRTFFLAALPGSGRAQHGSGRGDPLPKT